ncbi:MAG TPA: anthranilate phosphoribosyltransferase [Methanoregulaceae archaeon]|nr:anthranilate phosphoribosyltransferase [Methanoregulaceae archaeon]
MIREAIGAALAGTHLSYPQAEAVIHEIMAGEATDAQVAAFLTALQAKGPVTEEIAAFARVMRASAMPFHPLVPGMTLDTCGTGGDNSRSFNISTTTAFVVAGAGVPVVKHGNRSASGTCGSADVLEALGVNLAVAPDRNVEVMKKAGIAFLFAPVYHPAMGRVSGIRREIGIRTIFNLLGPLTNPACTGAQLIGVYNPALTGIFGEVLRNLGTERGLVVHGNGMDEITTTGVTRFTELKSGNLRHGTISSLDYGIPMALPGDIAGGDTTQNARILTEVLGGERGACRDIVVLNAGAAIYTAGKAVSIREGVDLAVRSIDTGKAMDKLTTLVESTGGAQ